MHKTATNPFTFGDLALDESFTDREDELEELTSDMLNGQNVLVYAPRRYGKSSLVLRAAQEAMKQRALVGYCDLMRTPTKERFAAALAKTIYADVASLIDQAFERAVELFRGLRVRPTMEVDPVDGSLRFSFQAGRRKEDIDDTIERLLELLGELAAERKRRVVIIFDEFQEILALDKRFPNLMRAVFQAQPEVSHVYLGSKRHVLERIFNDVNEPFWRSAKQLELGMIAPEKFAPFIHARFLESGKGISDEALERLLRATAGHPYGTQELAYFVWELVPPGAEASLADVHEALARVLRSEHNHFAQLWDDAPHPQRLLMLALAAEPTRSVYSAGYHARHELPATPTLQTALAGLTRKELAGRNGEGEHCLIEPFFAEWLEREQRAPAPAVLASEQPAQH
ncbi:MAG TPA: ATP-binding protein [Gaiellaceae bacterium]|nr:ATP-binding protein [Gaiellaceae bacterium]